MSESFDICQNHLESALKRGPSEQQGEEALVFALSRKYGKEVALVMGVDALQVREDLNFFGAMQY